MRSITTRAALAGTAIMGTLFAVAVATSATAQDEETEQDPGAGVGERMHARGDHRVLHGELVVADGDGDPVTVAVQVGEIAAVDADTFTLTSEDGYEATYDLGEDAGVRLDGEQVELADIEDGDTVHVRALVDGDELTAQAVVAGDAHGPGGGGRGFGMRGHHGGPHTDGTAPGEAPQDAPSGGSTDGTTSGSAQPTAYGRNV